MDVSQQQKPLIIGHRGASRDAPENTLASFQLAFEQGADGIETDFRLTGDGEIVCHHDEGTARTAGLDVRISEATLAELRTLDVGRWKGEAWRGAQIPTLREVLGAIPPGKLLFMELKAGVEMIAPLADALADSAVQPRDVRLLCFSAEVVRALKERLPTFKACWLTDYKFRRGWVPSLPQILATIREIGADGLASRDRRPLDSALVQALRREGLEIHVWTVDAAPAAARLVALGVDSIMTNRPGWLRSALSAYARGKGAVPGADARCR